MGFVRDDGKTMTAQPHLDLDPKKMWTLDHMRRLPAAAEPERPAQRDETTPERAAFVADYNRQGPAGRPAPASA